MSVTSQVSTPLPRLKYAEAMAKYGSDKPDLRNPIEMQVVSDHFRGSGFGIFAKLLEQEGTEVRAIPAPTGGSRKFADRMNAFAQSLQLTGTGKTVSLSFTVPAELVDMAVDHAQIVAPKMIH